MPAGCSHLKYRRRRGERDGVREDGGPCVWRRRRDGVGGGRKRQDRQGEREWRQKL